MNTLLSQKFMALITLITFLFNVAVYSQNSNSRFNRISVNDGLSQSNVECIFQDSQGILWIGTHDGLNKYDGYDFIVYKNDSKDKNSISGNRVMQIVEDRNGLIWISTYLNGVSTYNRVTDKFTQYRHDPLNESSIISDYVRSVTIDKKGQIWASCYGGVSLYDKETDGFINYSGERLIGTGGNDLNIYSIVDYGNNEYIITAEKDALYVYNMKNHSSRKIDYQLETENIITSNEKKFVLIDSKGEIWVYGLAHGIYQLNNNFEFLNYYGELSINYALSNNNIGSVIEVDKGIYWVGTDGGGVNIIDQNTKSVSVLKHDPTYSFSISGNSIYNVFKDNRGIIWLGHFNNGISYYDKNADKFPAYFHNPDDINSISDKPVLAVFEDSKGRIWIGTDGGGLNLLNKLDNSFKHYIREEDKENTLSTNVITAINEDSKGNLLLGTWNGGFMIFNPETEEVRSFKTDSKNETPIHSNHVWAIEEDKNGNIWLGLIGHSIDMYNPETEEVVNFGVESDNPNKVGHPYIMTIFEDSDNNLWFGSEGGGVFKYLVDEDVMLTFEHDSDNPNSLVDNTVLTIFEDSEGKIWMGTQSKGISIYNPEDTTYTVVNKSSGLPSDVIQGIIEDENNTFWISTTNGVSNYNPKDNSFRNYDIKDGLQSNEFKYNASLLDSEGLIYMGGMKGLNVFHPDSIKDNAVIPPIYFTGFDLFDVPVKIGDENSPLTKHISETDTIHLTFDQNVFTLSFVALNFTSTIKNQYAYKLIGFDNDYRLAVGDRKASYTNLDPGKYTFHVKASNNDNIWNEEGARLTIIISPPWWATWWFRVVVLGLSAYLIYFIIQFREKQAKETKRILESKIEDGEKLIQAKIKEVEKQKQEIKKRERRSLNHGI